ncbi:MAG TPA: TetR/AcrR family transcriptional regulator [Desulfitobacterium dehalogenans]|uniref:TetR/AcrR family transcriptional regulator n=1 Tax=Desulfitobacterium dehalogenans TaxID=36854 RepID=A0A7C7DD94_9FIRM|nr:TetR/AcrR family transcriptional regulator [Desulfitobacterium dehalogenans]
MARNKYPEVTINRILDTSMKLFMSKGYEHTTIQDIIDELGDLSKGAIYHHFKSKEEIMDAVNKRLAEQGIADIKTVAHDSSISGLDKLCKMLMFSIQSAQHEALDQTVPPFLRNPQLLALHMRDTMGSAADLLTGVIEEGIRDGSIHTAQPRRLAQMILLFFNVWFNPWMYSWTPNELKDIISFARNVFKEIGVPIFTEEVLQSIDELHSLSQKQK